MVMWCKKINKDRPVCLGLSNHHMIKSSAQHGCMWEEEDERCYILFMVLVCYMPILPEDQQSI